MKKTLLAFLCFMISAVIFAQSSNDGFMFLEVDGIRVHITEIRFGKNYSSSETTASISLNRSVDLTGNPDDVFEGNISLMLENGYDNLEFDFININMSGGVEIMGHAYDQYAGTHIYTTASGIGSVDTGSSLWTAPNDYDYLTKDYIYHEGDGGRQNETTFMTSEVTFDPSAGIDIGLLVDTYKVAYYWDGNNDSRHGFVQTWPFENPTYFPEGTPVIGLTYMPFYVSINRNLQAETYVVASNSWALDGLSTGIFDEKNSMVVTLVFDEDTGDFFIGRTANWDSLDDYQLNLPQFVRSGTLSGSSYTFSLSSYDNQNGGWTNNQTITGFERLLNVGDTGSSATVSSSGSSDYTLHYYRVD